LACSIIVSTSSNVTTGATGPEDLFAQDAGGGIYPADRVGSTRSGSVRGRR
jgi:hypothetical protein